MKLKALALALSLTLAIGTPVAVQASGIPVVDVAAIAEAIRQYQQMVEQLKTMQTQLQTAKDQLSQAQQLYSSMTGDRGMQNVMSGENRNVIPSNWQETLAQMNGLAQDIKANASRVDAATLDRLAPRLRDAHSEWMTSAASQQAAAGQSYDNASQRFGRLQSLMDAIPTATDAKAIADLQARIQVEQAMLQNESIKLQALAQAADAQRRLEERQQAELGMRKPVGRVTFPNVIRGSQ